MRAGLYARISSDRDGEALGVERQRQDCHRLAEQRGWQVVGEFIDNDVSAYSGKRRPEYEALLRAISSGEVNAIVVYRSDRLYRRMRDLERLVSVVEQHGIAIATVASGDIDLSTADGRMLARIIGSTAAAESERAGERIRRQRLQQVEEGRRQGGGHRPFGWSDTSMTEQVPAEVELIRDAVARVLAGESVYSVSRDWNERGVRTTYKQSRWKSSNLRDLLLRPHLAGLRYHAPTGTTTTGAWQAIITVDEHRLLVARLAPTGERRIPHPRSRRRLLSGLLRCDLCQAKLIFSGKRYVCDRGRGAGCGQTRANARALELEVLRLAEQVPRQHVAPSPDLSGALAELRLLDQRDAELAEMLGAGELDRASFTRARQRVQARRDELESVLRDANEPSDDWRERIVEALDQWSSGATLDADDLALMQTSIVSALGPVIYVSGARGDVTVRVPTR